MKYSHFLLSALFILTACQSTQDPYNLSESNSTTFSIFSNDSTLVNIFNWATERSNKYVGNDTDSVGPWYEAA